MRHWGILALLGCGAALRAATMAGYWPALVFIDTTRYLKNYALGIDPLGYHYLFTTPILLLSGGLGTAGLAWIVAVQHLLGLAMGAALYALVFRHGAPRWLAALTAAPVLLDSYQLQAEQLIMSDVLFEALICAALLVIAWPSAGKRIWARVAVAAILIGIATTVRQVGEAAVIPLLAYAVLARRPGAVVPSVAARVWRALAGLVLFAVPVLGYMTFSATVLGAGFSLTNVNETYFYARLANAADCATLRLPHFERPLCPAGHRLGIDALANSPASPFHTYRAPAGQRRGAMIDRFDLAVLTQQPFRVADSIGADAAKLFALTRDGDPGDPPIADSQFQTRYPVYQPAYGVVFRPGTARPRTNRVVDSALRWYQLHGGFTPGPLLLAFALLSVVGAFDSRSPRQRRAAAAAAAILALAVVGGADCYEFTWRYQLPALLLLPPGGALGALAVTDAVRRRLARQDEPDEPVLLSKPVPASPDLVPLAPRCR